MIADEIAAIHDRLESDVTPGNGRFLAGFHHFYRSAAGTGEVSEKLMIFVELGQLHHLLHHLGFVRRSRGRSGGRNDRAGNGGWRSARLWSWRLCGRDGSDKGYRD